MAKKSKNQLLSEKILTKKESAWNKLPAKQVQAYAEPYKKFLTECKTEREVVEWAENIVTKKGYKNIDSLKSIKSGDKLYKKTHKNFVLIRYKGMDKINAVISHIDSPRLDLKPNPLIEDSFLSMFKTHYYGGIVKYHWVNIPLAIHGVVYKKNGEKVTFKLGEHPNDPVFVINDLLPHLGRERAKAEASKIIPGENLSITLGSIPLNDPEIHEQVKLNTMKILHDKYGMIEEDFVSAELEIVPAFSARDCGLDNSMIAAYGQDDRVCAYTGFDALLTAQAVKHTAMMVFFDKEEIGSEGNTGAKSEFLKHLIEQMTWLSGKKIPFANITKNMSVLSGDVTAAFDPNYKDVFEPANAAYLGRGVSIEKYNGYGGKFGGNDASAEYFFKIRNLLNKNKICWQAGELGKVDEGGGGTIAVFVATLGAEVIDAGPAVLGMHSPYEVSSKADVYTTYQLYKAFFEQM